MKPLYEALLEYKKNASVVFHMPGHKLGQGFAHDGAFRDPAFFDVTELDATDDLHNPQGPLLDAQELAARAFGAGRTWFLVNGSSCGIFAMIAAVRGTGRSSGRYGYFGQKILVARDFHYSAFNAMCFAGVRPIYITVNKENHILNPGCVEDALNEHPDAMALYITRPGYFGNVCAIEEITRIAQKRGVLVLVDEAHGAHLAFSRRLPVSALEGGADICVQSAHKTLPAFTQCAFLHASKKALSEDIGLEGRISDALRAFQTSSPSFLLMASLDYAREYMELRGESELNRVLDNCESFYVKMAACGYGIPSDIWPIDAEGGGGGGGSGGDGGGGDGENGDGSSVRMNAYARDMTRLVLDTRPIGLSGTEVERQLWSRYRIKIEMSSPEHIVMIATVSDSDENFAALANALKEIAHSGNCSALVSSAGANKGQALAEAADCDKGSLKAGASGDNNSTSNKTASSYENICINNNMSGHHYPAENTSLDFMTILHMPKHRLPLSAAKGHISAEIVAPYPPGIPILCPGETITRDAIFEIQKLLKEGYIIKGIQQEDMTIAECDSSDRGDGTFLSTFGQ